MPSDGADSVRRRSSRIQHSKSNPTHHTAPTSTPSSSSSVTAMPGDPKPLLSPSAESSDASSLSSSPSPTPTGGSTVSRELSVAEQSLLHPAQHPLRLQDKQPLLPTLVTEPLLTDGDATPHSGPVDQRYRPLKRWVYSVPDSFEKWFAWLDDPIIAALQAPLNSSLRLPVIAFALFVTFFTSIEFGLILPFTLYLTHYDALADHSLPFMLLLALLSQIPKRFLWRPRPWMVQRALKVRKDKTSSFPSRAVTCAVLYGALLAMAVDVRQIGWGAVVGLAVCGAVFAAMARVIVGAHYPSDCVFGLVSGMLTTLLGEAFHALLAVGCSACANDSCYTSNPSAALTLSHVSVNWLTIVAVVLLSSAVLLALVSPPVYFWTKAGYVLAVLTPCLLFRLTFLCPSLNSQQSLPQPDGSASVVTWVVAAVVAVFCTACAKAMNALKGAVYSWLAFVALTSLLYVILIVARLNKL